MIWGYHYFWKHPNGIYFSLKRGRNRNWCFLQTIGNFPGLHLLWHGWEIVSYVETTTPPRHPIQFNLICIGKNMKQKHEKTWQNDILTARQTNQPPLRSQDLSHLSHLLHLRPSRSEECNKGVPCKASQDPGNVFLVGYFGFGWVGLYLIWMGWGWTKVLLKTAQRD